MVSDRDAMAQSQTSASRLDSAVSILRASAPEICAGYQTQHSINCASDISLESNQSKVSVVQSW